MAQQAKLDDSNVKNLGGEEHRDAVKDAAEAEAAFEGAGKEPGVEVWRVENFGVRRVPRKETGTFYMGDSYLVLFTYKEGSSERLLFNLHFWLGKDTTQDEAATSAYKTVELDTLLGDTPVQYREVQGYESLEFRRLFPRMKLLEGGVDSGFSHVAPEEYRPRLLHVKGKEYVQITQVPLRSRSLNDGDCFVLDAGLRVFQWNGSESNHHERRRANEAVQQIKEDRHGKPTSEVVDGLEEHEEFWSALGGRPSELSPATPDDVAPPRRSLFRLSDASGKMQFVEVAQGADAFKRDLLDPNDAFIVDTGVTVYAWVGHGASAEERKQAIRYAMQYLDENDRPITTPVVRVVEGGEPLSFQKAFDAPPPALEAAAGGARASGAAESKQPEVCGFDGVLSVTCHEARNLVNVQAIGKQDPLMEVRLRGSKQRFRTRVHKDGQDKATWNETFLMEIGAKDASLRLTVVNQNIVVDKDIGRVELPLEDVIRSASHSDRWVKLLRKGEPAGEVRVTVVYKPTYVITVLRAEKLRGTQMIGKMDPYVRTHVNNHRKQKGKISPKGDKDPVWEGDNLVEFRYNLAVLAQTEILSFEVMNENPISDDLVGGTGANVGNLIKMAGKEPQWLPLTSKGGKQAGRILVKVAN